MDIAIASDQHRGEEYEPGRKNLRAQGQAALNPGRQHPAVGTDLLRVRKGLTVVTPYENVQVFVFNQIRIWIPDSILKIGDLLEWHREAKFLIKPPACSCESLLTRTWMAATGIRPTLRKVVFACGSLLQQKLAIRVGNQN
jgi:hypothetical protein